MRAAHKVLATSERLTALITELERSNEKLEEMKNELSHICTWSVIFDDNDIKVREILLIM